MHTHLLKSELGLEFGKHVTQLNKTGENIWLGSVQIQLVLNEFVSVFPGHNLHVPYLAYPGWHKQLLPSQFYPNWHLDLQIPLSLVYPDLQSQFPVWTFKNYGSLQSLTQDPPLTTYPRLQTHKLLSWFGEEFAIHVIHENLSVANTWLGLVQIHPVFLSLTNDPNGHCLQIPAILTYPFAQVQPLLFQIYPSGQAGIQFLPLLINPGLH